jgi:hypothetical protein
MMKRSQLILLLFILLLPVFILLLLQSCNKDEDTKTPLQLTTIIYNYNAGYYEFQYNEDETLASIKWLDNEDAGEYITYDFTWQDEKINTVAVVQRNADGSVYSNEQNFKYTYNDRETIVTKYYQDDTMEYRYYKDSLDRIIKINYYYGHENHIIWEGDNVSSSQYVYNPNMDEIIYTYDYNVSVFTLIDPDVLIWLRLYNDAVISYYFLNALFSYNNCTHHETTFNPNGSSYIKRTIDYSYSINVYHRPSILTGLMQRFHSDGTLDEEEDFLLEFVYKK